MTPADTMRAALPDEVLQLLNHIEDVVGDEAWARIDAKLWNAVTALAVPAEAPNLPSLEWEGHQVWGDFTSLEAVRKAVRVAGNGPDAREPVALVIVHKDAEDEFFWSGKGALLELPPGEYDLYLAAGVAPARQYLHPTRVDALITVLEGECDGLSVTRETAEAILHYLENAPDGVAPTSAPVDRSQEMQPQSVDTSSDLQGAASGVAGTQGDKA